MNLKHCEEWIIELFNTRFLMEMFSNAIVGFI